MQLKIRLERYNHDAVVLNFEESKSSYIVKFFESSNSYNEIVEGDRDFRRKIDCIDTKDFLTKFLKGYKKIAGVPELILSSEKFSSKSGEGSFCFLADIKKIKDNLVKVLQDYKEVKKFGAEMGIVEFQYTAKGVDVNFSCSENNTVVEQHLQAALKLDWETIEKLFS